MGERAVYPPARVAATCDIANARWSPPHQQVCLERGPTSSSGACPAFRVASLLPVRAGRSFHLRGWAFRSVAKFCRLLYCSVYARRDNGLEFRVFRRWQRLTSHGAASPRGQQPPGDSALGRSANQLNLLRLRLQLIFLLLLRVGLDVFKTCDPSRERVVARQQLVQQSHHGRIGWCCDRVCANARGSALADASVSCPGSTHASSFPLFSQYVQSGGLTPTISSGARTPPSWTERWSAMPRK